MRGGLPTPQQAGATRLPRHYLSTMRRLMHGMPTDLPPPFLRASETGNDDVVRLLLDHNADAHVQDNSRNAPLHFAASRGHLKVAQIVLECNVEVNSQNDPITPSIKGWVGRPRRCAALAGLRCGCSGAQRQRKDCIRISLRSWLETEEIVQLLSKYAAE